MMEKTEKKTEHEESIPLDEVRQNLLHNLSLTPEQRILKHEKAWELVKALQQAHKDLYGKEPRRPS